MNRIKFLFPLLLLCSVSHLNSAASEDESDAKKNALVSLGFVITMTAGRFAQKADKWANGHRIVSFTKEEIVPMLEKTKNKARKALDGFAEIGWADKTLVAHAVSDFFSEMDKDQKEVIEAGKSFNPEADRVMLTEDEFAKSMAGVLMGAFVSEGLRLAAGLATAPVESPTQTTIGKDPEESPQ